jgi:hypothetical protein
VLATNFSTIAFLEAVMSAESSASGFDHPPRFEVDVITGSITARSTWLTDILHQLDAIRELPQGWDSHGGDAIDAHIVSAAEKLAKDLARFPEIPRPLVCPTAAGGIQLEWESKDVYFEIHIEEAEEANCYFESQSPRSEKEFVFHDGDDVCILAKYVSQVRGC